MSEHEEHLKSGEGDPPNPVRAAKVEPGRGSPNAGAQKSEQDSAPPPSAPASVSADAIAAETERVARPTEPYGEAASPTDPRSGIPSRMARSEAPPPKSVVAQPTHIHGERMGEGGGNDEVAERAAPASPEDSEDASMENEFREAVADAEAYIEDDGSGEEEKNQSRGMESGRQPPEREEASGAGTGTQPADAPGREQRPHPQPRQRQGRRAGHGQGQSQHGPPHGRGRASGGHGQAQAHAHGQGRSHGQNHGQAPEHARRDIISGRRQPQAFGRKPVKVEILANTSFEETRIAVLENGRLVELLWERNSAESIVGNIYKGVIENVLPGISSAFIDIGFEKNAYLYISDVLGDARAPIDHTLKKGQQVMIQVAKEAIGTKGMKVTMNISLPGRYLVFTPFEKETAISKHITDSAERSRLSTLVNHLAAEHLGGRGVVVRTEAEGATDVELTREVKYLWRTWEAIQRRFDSSQAPAPLHKDLDLTMQVARDMLSEEVYVYLMDNKESYQNVLDFIAKISPDLKERVRYYDGKTPIFSAFHIEAEIEKLRQIKVSLPSGGTIVVQEAESLCAIDVNTGRFTGSKSQEETVTMTNIEAAQEIAHQLRLRNIGGIVVIDFIDMKKASNRNRVMEALAEAVKRDRAKIRILPITRLGLIEMTRERKRESTVSLMTDECPECHGAGRVLSAESLRIRIQREIKELTQGRPGGQIRLQLHPQLMERFREMQNIIEKNVHRAIKIQPDPMLSWEDYKIILE